MSLSADSSASLDVPLFQYDPGDTVVKIGTFHLYGSEQELVVRQANRKSGGTTWKTLFHGAERASTTSVDPLAQNSGSRAYTQLCEVVTHEDRTEQHRHYTGDFGRADRDHWHEVDIGDFRDPSFRCQKDHARIEIDDD
uniref:Uncharacterized protein n=1 Tax=Kwoniella dejecticola CBS 10117 TaxID=1296121 RepID=A0A1A6AFA8_9TREE|nr:uncharacterized protein I303_00572 [Kwoniella dejecticola CBS 10117]OBR88755.1 hypothetical protein I303_00572 [Kwoniella dejecticola CBS 10117]